MTNTIVIYGGWISNPRYCRALDRYDIEPDYRFGRHGFRLTKKLKS